MSSAIATCLSKQREAVRISEALFEGACQAPGVLLMASDASGQLVVQLALLRAEAVPVVVGPWGALPREENHSQDQ